MCCVWVGCEKVKIKSQLPFVLALASDAKGVLTHVLVHRSPRFFGEYSYEVHTRLPDSQYRL